MFSTNQIRLLLFIIATVPFLFSCKKDTITTSSSAKLSFETDTLKFDTVFTTQGSATRSFKVYNPNSQKVSISSIRLAGGTASFFRMNVDGTPTYSITNVEIAAHDSLYIFVALTVNPNNNNNPFVVADSILFTTNGNNQKVILTGYGQNAHFFNADSTCTTTWSNDKPYVIINSFQVNKGCTLIIQQGVKVYMHYGSYLIVKGTLLIQGTATDSVVFKGDRLEHDYDDIPGQWGGILILRGSTGNDLTHAVINEATSGVIIGSSTDTAISSFNTSNEPNVAVNQCIIKNCLSYGIFSFLSAVNATNTLIYSCGQDDVFQYYGGTGNYINCTLADFGSLIINHQYPVAQLTDYFQPNGIIGPTYTQPSTTNFYNTIINGDIFGGNEIGIDTTVTSGDNFNYLFQNCLLTTQKSTSSTTHYQADIVNQDPQFKSVTNNDYHILSTSPCKDAGETFNAPSFDLEDWPRSDGKPDIGCYEFH